jgi:hypothetical protein
MRLSSASPVPPVSKERLQGYFGNRYFQFENIRTAALKNKFTLVQVADYRNAALVADRAAAKPERQKFIAWAVELLRSRRSAGNMTMSQVELLAAWNALPDEARALVTKVKGPSASFRARGAKRFLHGSFTLQAPNGCCANDTAGALGRHFFFPPVPRTGFPRTRKYTNAASVGSMNSLRYCGSEQNLETTGVQMASNHAWIRDRRKTLLAWMEDGRFGKTVTDLAKQ